jgi:hypothetical protein
MTRWELPCTKNGNCPAEIKPPFVGRDQNRLPFYAGPAQLDATQYGLDLVHDDATFYAVLM